MKLPPYIRPICYWFFFVAFWASWYKYWDYLHLDRHAHGRILIHESYSRLRGYARAFEMYSQDYDGEMPPLKTPQDKEKLHEVMKPYFESFHLSKKGEDIDKMPIWGIPYAQNTLLSSSTAKKQEAETTVILYEPVGLWTGYNYQKARNVAFLDGHVERISGDKWEAWQKAGKVPSTPDVKLPTLPYLFYARITLVLAFICLLTAALTKTVNENSLSIPVYAVTNIVLFYMLGQTLYFCMTLSLNTPEG
jgi:prepilin-type processing-associated H-X9-DG protein